MKGECSPSLVAIPRPSGNFSILKWTFAIVSMEHSKRILDMPGNYFVYYCNMTLLTLYSNMQLDCSNITLIEDCIIDLLSIYSAYFSLIYPTLLQIYLPYLTLELSYPTFSTQMASPPHIQLVESRSSVVSNTNSGHMRSPAPLVGSTDLLTSYILLQLVTS